MSPRMQMPPPSGLGSFRRSLNLALALLTAMVLSFVVYVWSEKQIDLAHEQRHLSFQLAIELRQSSDDLTRMVRTYVVTGDPVYLQHYQDILDIRDGKMLRPDGYERIYWDFVTANGARPQNESGHKAALLERMRQAGFSDQEFSKLAEAKANSDALTTTERNAMALIRDSRPSDDASRNLARQMLHDAHYHQFKARIMEPIDECMRLVDTRTRLAVLTAENRAIGFRTLLILVGLGLMFFLLRTYRLLLAIMGGSLEDVHAGIAALGHGDFSTPIEVKTGSQDSVMGWLQETQLRLQDMTRAQQASAEELEALNTRLLTLVEAIPDAIIFKDGAGRWQITNTSAKRLFRLYGLPWQGKTDAELALINPQLVDTHQTCQADDERAWRAGRLSLFAEQVPDDQGSQRELEVRKVPTFDPDQQRRGLVVIARDVTESNLAKQKLLAADAEAQRALRFNEALLNAIPVAVFFKDREGRYLGCNPAFSEIMGVSAAEIRGKTVYELWPSEMAETYHQKDLDLMLHPEPQLYEFKVRDRQGVVRPVLYAKDVFRDDKNEVAGIIGAFLDISERKQAEERLRLAAAVFEHTIEAVVITDPDSRIVAVNPGFSEITGYTAEEAIGQTPRLFKSDRHERDFYRTMWAHIEADGTWQGEVWNRRRDGTTYPGLLTISSVRNSEGQLTHYLGVHTDLSDLKHTQQELDFLAHHDPLTGLANRALFHEMLELAIRHTQRDKHRFALLFMDLDHFKNINDSLGHPIGDRLLVEVGLRLREELRDVDAIARVGGDEFNLLLEQINDPKEAGTIAQRIVERFAQPFDIFGHTLYIGTSIGIAVFPDDGTDISTLQRNADAALYQAKGEGRSTYRYFSRKLAEDAEERLALETLLRQAMEHNQLELYYQPQVDMASGQQIGVEALARWTHPRLGAITPARFIPLAEETGLIIPLGDWALLTACLQMRRWTEGGDAPPCVSVNVSVVQVARGKLVESVRHALAESGIDPAQLELEITESFIMTNPEAAIHVLMELDQLGVRMAIDDFGTGYSSLAYLKRLPVKRLKIDQSFVRDMLEDEADAAIVSAVIALGHSLGLEVVAEGVETAAHVEHLKQLGCDAAQGWFYGRPKPAS